MGFFGNAANRVRDWVRRDKSQIGMQFAKGTAPLNPAGYDMMQAYGYDVLADALKLEHDLISRFVDYEEMDEYGAINAAIDIMADDSTQPETTLNRTVWVTSQDQTVEQVIDDLFHRQLRLDEEIWEIARTVVKYGVDYEELLVTDEGVRGLNFLPPPTVRRIEGPRGELYGFVQDFRGRFGFTPAEFQQLMASRAAAINGIPGRVGGLSGMDRAVAFEDWEVVNFRLRGKHRRSVYGHSVLDGARWIWKRLVLLEDAAMIYRLQRAPERYAFYVDVGDLPPNEAMAYINRVRQQHRKKKFLNPSSGKLDLKHEPMDQMEDFFVPIRQGVEGTRIEVLGSPSWQSVTDVEYFRDHLFAALKIPKTYLAQADGVNRGTLSSEDVRFARLILRIQRELRNGLAKVARVHMAALNIDPQVEYAIHMQVPSAIFELAQLEVKSARADLAARMREFVSLYYIQSKIFGMSDEEIEHVNQQRDSDAERDANVAANSQSVLQRSVGAASVQGQAQGQVDATSIMTQAGLPDPNTPPVPAKRESSIRGPLIKVMPSPPKKTYYDLERRLFEGSNKEAEKRLEGKVDKLLREDQSKAHQLHEIGMLLRELGGTMSTRSNRNR